MTNLEYRVKGVIAKKALIMGIAMVGAQGAQAESGPGFDDPNNWPQYHRSYNAWRYSPLNQINRNNIKRLHVAWIHQPGVVTHGLQATPIVIDGVMYYIAADNNVFALDAATGKTLWHYKPKLAPITREVFYASASRGVTVGRGKVFVGTLDGRFVALDQKTGKELWSTQLTNQRAEQGALFSAPPQLAGNILFGGTTGGDQPIIGKIFAVNADTGERTWTFEIPRDDPNSWPGDSRSKAGGSAWMPGTYDPTTDTIYIGTSNAAPDFNREGRVGDNLYTASLLALDPKTGKLKWYRQEVPNDTWDFDAAYEALLVPDGHGKTALVHLNKNGFVYVMDKDTGAMRNAWQYAENMNWAKGVDPKTGLPIEPNYPETDKQKLHCPNLLGARSWNAGAYNPGTKLWYSQGMEVCNTVTSAKQGPTPGINTLTLGLSEITLTDPPGKKADGWLAAFNPLTGKQAWKVRFELPPLSNVLATGGGLVFTGDMVGNLYAFDADNGKELWKFNAGSGARGGPVSYAVNGKQYIAIPTGLGSHAPGFLTGAFPQIRDLPGGAAMMVFAVD
ncbi:PQQ-binding-like beta-propeller repeat protein [Cupriavidus sp. WKF15]|uniref:pyrroloquinoline quinone-dependent dehydrogenase n=1 Tax=Cupriavidus sp. WKF15 TaxID=3032282 RepID=UPI0023E2AC24|nr:PQQ-binding-like beta-propeller repeat protein [Cupriavidus sp. WKF15]WER50940.1 PQQ-binding-like beta-propeller repeat protein [Cupriavidus sp. WKF15]